MTRFAAIALTTAVITGCAAPVPITVATLVMDGVSYVATEKSMTDHGISALADKDCAMHRVLADEYMCKDFPKETEVAETKGNPAQTSTRTLRAQPTSAVTAHSGPVSSYGAVGTQVPGVYMVIASSSDQKTAKVYEAQYKSLTPTLFAMPTGPEKVSYHLLTGPVTRDEYEHARVNLKARGLDNVWALKVDALDWALSKELIGKVRPVQAAAAVQK